MGRINTNVSSLIAQRALAKNNTSLNTSLQRLSTGLKINTGADDPAGLIASDVNNLHINAANLPANAPTNIVVAVTQSAQTATLGYTGAAIGANPVTVEISGNKGAEQVSIAGGATVANVISAVNGVKTAT